MYICYAMCAFNEHIPYTKMYLRAYIAFIIVLFALVSSTHACMIDIKEN